MPARVWFGLALFLILIGPAASQPTEEELAPKKQVLGPALDVGLKRVTLRALPRAEYTSNTSSRALDLTATEATIDPLLNIVDIKTYRLGPGDILDLNVAVPDTSQDHTQGGPFQDPGQRRRVVGADGDVLVFNPPMRVKVEGLVLSQAEGKLRKALGKYYRNVTMTLSLQGVRRFPVVISGEVAHPGTYTASGVTGAAQLILDAGGLSPVGSMRRVQLFEPRTNRVLKSLDFLRWQSLGDPKQNPYLLPGQSLVVPSVEREVELSGQVLNPGIYEILPGETLQDLMLLAGGMTAIANRNQIQLGRLEPDGTRKAVNLDVSLDDSPGLIYGLKAGDQIQVYDLSLAQGRVLVMGEVAGSALFPVEYNSVTGDRFITKVVHRLQEGETVRDLVLAVGGPTAKANLEGSWLERPGPEGQLLKIPINMRKLLSEPRDGPHDLVLLDGDSLVVPALPDTVFLAGHFFRPGPVPYHPGWGLREYLAAAGGTTEQASTKHARLIRAVPNEPPVVYAFDALEVIEEGGEVATDIRAGDVIYMPLYKDTLSQILGFLPTLYLLYGLFNQ